MTSPSHHATPSLRAAIREQTRAIALTLRIPTMAALALLALVSVAAAADAVRGRGGVDFVPAQSLIPGIVGLALPIAVWMGENPFGTGLFWTLPVDRRRHALIRVLAGWLWLMLAVALFVAWLFGVALATGGDVLAAQTIQLLPNATVPHAGTLDPSTLRTAVWTPAAALWLVPFTAGTGTYLLGSAFALGTRYPVRWIVGFIVGAFLVSGIGAISGVEWLKVGPGHLVVSVNEGRYGLDALLSARTESLKTYATLATGKAVPVWRGIPSLADWAVATVLWIAGGAVALWLAASRHGERRRARHSSMS